MKRPIFCFLILCMSFFNLQSQEWMTNLDFAKRLALTQNKMLFMMWEGATTTPFPVLINDSEGKVYLAEDLFESEELNRLIWNHFVPVSVNEDNYEAMYDAIEDRRSHEYLDKFNDNSIKIMDPNGTILNLANQGGGYLNLTDFISKYALDTSFLRLELKNYATDPNFYNAFYLSSKYLDYSLFANAALRPELMDLSKVYLTEAKAKISKEDEQKQAALQQRTYLLELESYLLKERPKKVLRKLKRLRSDEIEDVNTEFIAFLYFTSYRLRKDSERATEWIGKVSATNLKKSNLIVKLFI